MSNHKKFLKHLTASTPAVSVVAKHLNNKGFHVEIPAIQKAPTQDQWKGYADDGDIYATLNGNKYRIEVKGSSRDFVCAEDWPYPVFFICAKHSFDFADPKPDFFFIVNKSLTHAAFLMGRDSHQWETQTMVDKRYDNYEQVVYTCKPEQVWKWGELKA